MRASWLVAVCVLAAGCGGLTAVGELLSDAGEAPSADGGRRIPGDGGHGTVTTDGGRSSNGEAGGRPVDGGQVDVTVPHDTGRDGPAPFDDGERPDRAAVPDGHPSDARDAKPPRDGRPADGHAEDGRAVDAHTEDAHAEDAFPRDALVDAGKPEQGAPYPTTCAAVGTANGTVTLYVNGDSAKPWEAECVGGKSYLALSNSNYSSYPTGTCATGTEVKTVWSKIAVDPTTLLVDTADYTGAVSTGNVLETTTTYTTTYTMIPYASARTCNEPLDIGGTPGAEIDLRGTPFTIGGTSAFTAAGYMETSAVTPGGGGSAVDLFIAGYPSGISACTNDYYTNTGGSCLQLIYP
jgi:hypothetical protein